MYHVSPDYLSKHERSSQSATLRQESPLQKTAQSTKHKTRARIKRKKGAKHPYDKWVATRGEIQEAVVGRTALIKAKADFIKEVLPGTTLAQKGATPKSVSAELVTQTVRNLTTPPQFVAIPSTSSAGVVAYETEASPVSTRYAGATAAAYDDDVDTGAVIEGEVHAFARKSFGEIFSPYLSPYFF